MPFVEALTQLQHKAGKGNFINILVSYIPIVNGEQKTKPTQYAVKSVRSAGLIPDLVWRPPPRAHLGLPCALQRADAWQRLPAGASDP